MDNQKPLRGRPFQKGNPGRRRGSRNKATLVMNSLTAEQGDAILQKAIKMAMDGNVPMMKFLLDRTLPKERSVELELPHLDYACNSVDAMAKIVDAVSSGRITPREAADVAQLVSTFTQAIEATDVEFEIGSLRSELDVLGDNLDRRAKES